MMCHTGPHGKDTVAQEGRECPGWSLYWILIGRVGRGRMKSLVLATLNTFR